MNATGRVRGDINAQPGMCMAAVCHAPTRRLADHRLSDPTCDQIARFGPAITTRRNPGPPTRKAPTMTATSETRPFDETAVARLRSKTTDAIVAAAMRDLGQKGVPCRHCGGSGVADTTPTTADVYTAITGRTLVGRQRQISYVWEQIRNPRMDAVETVARKAILDLADAIRWIRAVTDRLADADPEAAQRRADLEGADPTS